MRAATFTSVLQIFGVVTVLIVRNLGRDWDAMVLLVGVIQWPFRAEPQTAKVASALSSVWPTNRGATESGRLFNITAWLHIRLDKNSK